MNKKTLFAAAVGLVIIVGVGWIAINNRGVHQKEESAMMAEKNLGQEEAKTEMAKENQVASTTVNAMNEEKGSYEAYAPEKIARAANGKVVLFFRASWCPTCKVLDANIRANLSAIPAGTTILDVDYDSHEDLKKKYNVTYQHTLVQVDAERNAIAKWSGSPTLIDVLAKVK